LLVKLFHSVAPIPVDTAFLLIAMLPTPACRLGKSPLRQSVAHLTSTQPVVSLMMINFQKLIVNVLVADAQATLTDNWRREWQ
jgi:hypothetical protein